MRPDEPGKGRTSRILEPRVDGELVDLSLVERARKARRVELARRARDVNLGHVDSRAEVHGRELELGEPAEGARPALVSTSRLEGDDARPRAESGAESLACV